MQVYLDNGATTKTAPEVAKAIQPYLTEQYGNPESIHALGRKAQEALEQARKQIASKLNFQPHELIFTSSGTEANNLALFGVAHAMKKQGNHIIVSNIEHSSILEACKRLEKEGFEVTYLLVNKEGLVDIKKLEHAITPKTIIVSIMHANNEIGVIQPINEIYSICKKKKIFFHTDAAQSFCKTKTPEADLISISAHKIHGPKGIAALAVKENVPIQPQILGGMQEQNKRAGTHNVPGIIGFAKATTLITEKDIQHMTELKNYFIQQLLTISTLNGSKNRLCNNINLTFPGQEADSLLLKLDEQGIACSAGSACNTKKATPSHVLKALGLPKDKLNSTLRFTLSKYTTKTEIEYTLKRIKELL
ncbi:cysteine desulfurase NifS [Candidatus Woesearchaeota archaeon CG10_big_fil_rev_8_21_14_0_10_37_12]|nr:MAG: cysteine desulfurase NifS [Candidatus Woesearchaeota archaeon CG10_big_fil_rev_8_21_14_0_10_37_12]